MFKWICFVAVLVSISALPMAAQNPRGMPSSFPDISSIGDQSISPATAAVDPARARMEMLVMQRENQDRQVALKRDTDKLLELANELKQNVDRTGPDILSMDVVKKAQEIEKLAKSVKEKMKGD
jgi:hypothetical protein